VREPLCGRLPAGLIGRYSGVSNLDLVLDVATAAVRGRDASARSSCSTSFTTFPTSGRCWLESSEVLRPGGRVLIVDPASGVTAVRSCATSTSSRSGRRGMDVRTPSGPLSAHGGLVLDCVPADSATFVAALYPGLAMRALSAASHAVAHTGCGRAEAVDACCSRLNSTGVASAARTAGSPRPGPTQAASSTSTQCAAMGATSFRTSGTLAMRNSRTGRASRGVAVDRPPRGPRIRP